MTFEGHKDSFAFLYKHYDLHGSEPCRGIGPRNGGGEYHQNGRFVLFLQWKRFNLDTQNELLYAILYSIAIPTCTISSYV